MAGGDVAQAPKKQKKGSKKVKKRNRVSARVDLTPMVDVVMLLITFFMLTTVFTQPQTMEINLPPDQTTQVEVGESSLLTLRVLSNGTLYWNLGIETPQVIDFKELRPFLEERLRQNPKLITLLKVEREGTYNMMVDVMDEFQLANVTRFSTAPFREIDKKVIEKGIGGT